MASPLRTCVVSRREAGPDELVRLVLGPDGEVFVDYRSKLGGRGAWVTARRKELEILQKKPRILGRALKGQANPGNLLERVRAANFQALDYGLSLAARSGAVAGGKERVRAALSHGEALMLLLAEDASERLKTDLRGRARETPVLEVPMDRDTLGAKVGKGPRAALVIKRGKVGAYLVRELRRMDDLR